MGVLITDNDRVKVVAGASCDASALAAKFDNMALGESRALTFTFDVYTEEMMMCFRFAEDSTYVPLFPITVKVLNAAFFLTGHPEVVVARQPKTVTFTGEGLSTSDKARFSFGECAAAAYEFDVTQAEAFQAEVLIPTATSSAPLTLCYVFGNEPRCSTPSSTSR